MYICGSLSVGVAARAGKVVGSVMRYNNCGVVHILGETQAIKVRGRD